VSDSASDPDLQRALARVLAPLVEADQGELYLVRGAADPAEIHLHLGGRFSGCPGNALVTAHVIRPLLAAASPARRVHVTSGAILPPGAERILPGSSSVGG
jgi:Fe-S cluster biogenesis protein NfuA